MNCIEIENKKFAISDPEISDGGIKYYAWQIISEGMNNENSSAEYQYKKILSFYIKWDGCAHLWFGDDICPGYIHVHNLSGLLVIGKLIEQLFFLAEKDSGKKIGR